MVQDWYKDNDSRASLESRIKLVMNTTTWNLSLRQTESFSSISSTLLLILESLVPLFHALFLAHYYTLDMLMLPKRFLITL